MIENERQAEVVAALESQPTPPNSVPVSNEVAATTASNKESEAEASNEKPVEEKDNLNNQASDDDKDDEVSSEATEDEEPPSISKKCEINKGKRTARAKTVEIEDTPSSPRTIDCKNIPPVKEPIPGGESFMHAGSVNTANMSRPQRFQNKEETALKVCQS